MSHQCGHVHESTTDGSFSVQNVVTSGLQYLLGNEYRPLRLVWARKNHAKLPASTVLSPTGPYVCMKASPPRISSASCLPWDCMRTTVDLHEKYEPELLLIE